MNRELIFKDRADAGKDLVRKLKDLKDKDIIVFGLPRGGMVVAYEVANGLNAELQALPIRKLSLPKRPELAMGAMSFDGTVLLDEMHIKILNIDKKHVDEEIESEKIRLKEMVEKFRKNKTLPNLEGKTAIVVDDGIATGYTAKTALKTLRKYNPKKLILATPVIDRSVYDEFLNFADEIVGNTVDNLMAVGAYYKEFGQTTDEDVMKILEN
jgi:putative phosphoribosyl transferase